VIEYGDLDLDDDPDTLAVRALRVTYPKDIVQAVAAVGGTLGFQFDATVIESGEIPNKATFVVTAPGGTATGEAEVVTKWGGYDVLKETSNGAVLPGASFNVAPSYADAIAGTNFIFDTDVQSDANGRLSFTGLRYSYWEDGKAIDPPTVDVDALPLDERDKADTGQIYWLVETKAPLGYQPNTTPIPFWITGQSDETVDLTVTNDPHDGFELPTIGGNRAVLPMLGALVVAGGVGWLVRSRRVND